MKRAERCHGGDGDSCHSRMIYFWGQSLKSYPPFMGTSSDTARLSVLHWQAAIQYFKEASSWKNETDLGGELLSRMVLEAGNDTGDEGVPSLESFSELNFSEGLRVWNISPRTAAAERRCELLRSQTSSWKQTMMQMQWAFWSMVKRCAWYFPKVRFHDILEIQRLFQRYPKVTLEQFRTLSCGSCTGWHHVTLEIW